MTSRYDFIKDPAERRMVARCQVGAALLFIAFLAAVMVFEPGTPSEPAASNVEAPTAGEPIEPRPIGFGGGA